MVLPKGLARFNRVVTNRVTGPLAGWLPAAGGCELEICGRQVPLTRPRLVHDPTRRDMPPVVRQLVGMIGVTDFLYLRTAPDADNVD